MFRRAYERTVLGRKHDDGVRRVRHAHGINGDCDANDRIKCDAAHTRAFSSASRTSATGTSQNSGWYENASAKRRHSAETHARVSPHPGQETPVRNLIGQVMPSANIKRYAPKTPHRNKRIRRRAQSHDRIRDSICASLSKNVNSL